MTRSLQHKVLLAGLIFCILFLITGTASATQQTSLFKPLLSLGRGYITNAEWQSSSNHIFISTSHSLWIYDDMLNDVMHSDDVRLAVVHPSQNLIAAVYQSKAAILDSTTLEPVKVFDEPVSNLSQLQWSLDGSKLAAVQSNGLVHVWDAVTYRLLLEFWESPGTSPALNWSPDSTRLLALDPGEDTASIWDVNEARQETIFYLKAKSKYNVGGGRLIWSEDRSNILRIVGLQESGLFQSWDVQTGKLLYETENNGTFTTVYNPDGKKLLLFTFGSGLIAVDPHSFMPLVSYEKTPMSISAQWSRDGRLVLGYGDEYPANWNGFLGIWDAVTGKLLNHFKSDSPVTSVLWSPNNQQLLTINQDNTIQILDISSGKVIAENAEHGLITGILAWNADGSEIAIGDKTDTVRIWDISTKRVVTTLKGSLVNEQLVWQPSGKLLAVLNFLPVPGIGRAENDIVRIWDTETSKLVASIPIADKSPSFSLRWTDDGKNLLVASYYGDILYWNANRQEAIPLMNFQKATDSYAVVYGILLSPDNNKLLILGDPCCAGALPSIWDAKTGKTLKSMDQDLSIIRHNGIYAWNLDSNKLYLATWPGPDSYCGDGGCGNPLLDPDRFNVWIQLIYRSDGSTEKQPVVVLRHTDYVTSALWSPDASHIATTTADNLLHIWNVANGQIELTVPNINGYVWSPDSRFLALWHNNMPVEILDVSTGKVMATLNGLNGPVDWSPDSTKLTQFSDGQLIIWSKN